MSRILLVSPRFDLETALARELLHNSVQDTAPDSIMVPLHLATVAALTPEEFEVDIWDEGARGEITDETQFDRDYELVGVTGYNAHLPRAIQLAEIFHRRNLPVVIGGAGVSSAPHLCREVFDVIFLGEAELTWPRFLREWKQGIHRSEYRQVERPDLSDSPLPRWESIAADVPRYFLGGVQTTRGCPYDCEFCDVIHLFGRRPRHKPIDRVIEEIVQLQRLGVSSIFICDDDFIGDARYAKEFLRKLLPVNNGFDSPVAFNTQLTIDLAKDDELMELMADCNFTQVFIGIESPREASLRETNKVQNLRGDLVEDCKRIQSYGLAVKASLIVGFDADDVGVFDELLKFVEDAHIPVTTVSSLKAYPGTPLWLRLQQEQRVVDVSDTYAEAPRVVTNIIPKGMTRVELLEGYRRLLGQLSSWPSFEKRAIDYVSAVRRHPRLAPPSPAVRQQRMERLTKARSMIDRLPEDARTAITNVITATFAKAPFMIERMARLVRLHFVDAVLLSHHQEVIQKQIDRTRSGRLELDVDPSAGVIPPAFKARVKEIMPMLHQRLAEGINYKPGVPEAIVAVLKDFLIRWGKGFEVFEDFHYTYLGELCDRHVARWNQHHGGRSGGGGSALTAQDAGTKRFVTEVLVSVEQELRGPGPSGRERQLVGLRIPAGSDAASG